MGNRLLLYIYINLEGTKLTKNAGKSITDFLDDHDLAEIRIKGAGLDITRCSVRQKRNFW